MSFDPTSDPKKLPTTKSPNRRAFLRSSAMLLGGGAVLAACGAPSAGTGATATSPAADAAVVATTAPAQTSGDVVTLTQWYHQYGEEGVQEAVLRYAEEYSTVNPNVKVKVEWIPGDYGAKLNAAMLTPQGPDVFESQLSVDRVRAGQLAVLDDLYTEELKKDFGAGALQQVGIDGKLYGIKMFNDTAVLYYRKSMLEAAGVKPPTTADELIAAAAKLDSAKVKGLFIGNDGSGPWNIWMWSAGPDNNIVSADNKVGWNVERTALAYEKARELSKSSALLVGAPSDWWDPSAFVQGMTAMQWCGFWAMPAIIKELGDDVGVIPWPALDAQGSPTTFLGGWTQMVNAKGPHVEEAKAFAKWQWIENTKLQQDFNLAYGFHIPARASVAATADKLKSGIAAEVVTIAQQYARPELPLASGGVTQGIGDAFSNIVLNSADATTELTTAHEKAEAELTKLLSA